MKRWWGIRHIRYYWGLWRCQVWADRFGSAGIGLGIINPSDIDYLNKIWKGEV